MNEEAKKLATRAQAPLEPDPILQLISDAARDPGVDVNKMRALLDMKKEAMRDAAKITYAQAMNRVQEKIRPIAADAANPQTKSRYASYFALDKALRPIYAAEGFSLNFDTADGAPADYVRVVCDVAHAGGHERRHRIDMPADGKGAKGGDVMTKTHATGSAVTYGKRYLLGMIFNVAVGADDDDGNAANGDLVTTEQAIELQELVTKAGASRDSFLGWLHAEEFDRIQAKHYARAKKELLEKIAAKEPARA